MGKKIKINFTERGEWAEGEEYSKLDVVKVEEAGRERVFYSLEDGNTECPVGSDKWRELTLLSERVTKDEALAMADVPVVDVGGGTTKRITLESGKFYRMGVCDELEISLASKESGLAVYGGRFVTGEQGCDFSIPSSVTIGAEVPRGLLWNERAIIEFSISDNVLLLQFIGYQ